MKSTHALLAATMMARAVCANAQTQAQRAAKPAEPRQMGMDMSGKWLGADCGADCGDVKPVGAPSPT
jgi:hypothetical protein